MCFTISLSSLGSCIYLIMYCVYNMLHLQSTFLKIIFTPHINSISSVLIFSFYKRRNRDNTGWLSCSRSECEWKKAELPSVLCYDTNLLLHSVYECKSYVLYSSNIFSKMSQSLLCCKFNLWPGLSHLTRPSLFGSSRLTSFFPFSSKH